MKRITFLNLLMTLSVLANATDQVPDILFYQNQKLTLNTGWAYPSPLQTYFTQHKLIYPFGILSTANYRGHIATWEIENNKLFLREIRINDSIYKPKEFNIKSELNSSISNDKVFADWFSGVVTGQSNNMFIFHIRNGKVLDTQIITDKDIKKLQKISLKDTSDHSLMKKYFMVILNQNYISYFFRLNSKEDSVILNDKGGYLSNHLNMSPLLQYYSNDHMKWPFNWENYEKSGAPNCIWSIEDSLIYLVKVRLYSGSSFFSIDKDTLDLNMLFPDKVFNKKVFGDWVSGILVVKLGKENEHDVFPAYKGFTVSQYLYLRLEKGRIREMFTIPSNFDFNKLPENIDPGLKKIIEDFSNPTVHNSVYKPLLAVDLRWLSGLFTMR